MAVRAAFTGSSAWGRMTAVTSVVIGGTSLPDRGARRGRLRRDTRRGRRGARRGGTDVDRLPVARVAVLVHVQALDLLGLADPQADRVLDAEEHEGHGHADEAGDREHAHDLVHELVRTAAEEQALGPEALDVLGGEEPDGDGAP